MSSASEKRRFARAPIELKVEYKRLNTFFADYTKNISKGGTFIKTRKPLDIGTEFVFKLCVPTLADPIALNGKVQWVGSYRIEKNRWLMVFSSPGKRPTQFTSNGAYLVEMERSGQ